MRCAAIVLMLALTMALAAFGMAEEAMVKSAVMPGVPLVPAAGEGAEEAEPAATGEPAGNALPGTPLAPVPADGTEASAAPTEAPAGEALADSDVTESPDMGASADSDAEQIPSEGDLGDTDGTQAPAADDLSETDAAQAPAEDNLADPDAVQAPPVGDPLAPVWDGAVHQEAAAEAEVPSVVMTLQKPALALEGVRIGIDPGHQARGNSEKETVAPNSSQTKAKVSSGTSGAATHVAEYVTVLEIALKLRDTLEAQGAEVYMTRETHDVNISNQERAKMMNAAGVDLVLRIHCDGADNRSKHGIALYCSKSNSIAAESYRAAEAILPAVCAATGAQSNGIVSNDNYTGQNWSTVPCIMVECGFMSNPDEDRLLNDENYQQKLADGLTQGIIDYIAVRDGK